MQVSDQQAKQLEKQKKLLMKKLMSFVRLSFNKRQLPFYPFLLCVSIKPGQNERNATLQAYPNQALWKSLREYQDKNLMNEITEEVLGMALRLVNKFDDALIQEILKRIKHSFDFVSFYKDQKKQEKNQNQQSDHEFTNPINDLKNQILICDEDQFEKNESESKQLLKQIQLCSQSKKTILESMEKGHYHKLQQLLDKIKKFHGEQKSYEMNQFTRELEAFLDEKEPELMKKACLEQANLQQTNNIQMQNEEYQNELSVEEMLSQIKKKALSIEPGLNLFLPNYKNLSEKQKQIAEYVEEDYFKDLYYKRVVDQEEYTSEKMLSLWRRSYEPWLKQSQYLPFQRVQEQIVKTE